jgi:hypothetical protein
VLNVLAAVYVALGRRKMQKSGRYRIKRLENVSIFQIISTDGSCQGCLPDIVLQLSRGYRIRCACQPSGVYALYVKEGTRLQIQMNYCSFRIPSRSFFASLGSQRIHHEGQRRGCRHYKPFEFCLRCSCVCNHSCQLMGSANADRCRFLAYRAPIFHSYWSRYS